ncbi:MAG: hypothetical protein GX973_04935 [Firmicutes bacterium]|nr:hypothetical protein [Bacillota bacterium]
MILPQALQKLVRFIASPWGIGLVLAWMLGSIWTAYRRLKSRDRDRR